MSLSCELIVNSDVEHLQQIYTGYKILHDNGTLRLKQVIPKKYLEDKANPARWVDYRFFNTKVVLNDEITICYDTHDWNRIDEDILRDVDFYFKRSFDESYIAALDHKQKIFPLGLNYRVTSGNADFFRAKRSVFYRGKDRIKTILKSLRFDNFLPITETERLDRMESKPVADLPPKVLFMARAWDPGNVPDKSQKAIIEEINETRADSIRILRREFGEMFFGGLARDEFSQKYFNDVVLPDHNLSNKQNYLELLREFPICIATKGLNNSNGWKLAEYVAFSKAIVTEPLCFRVTGDFGNETNYLEFTNTSELVDAVSRLVDSSELRKSIMENNYKYYQNYVRPDALVLKTLRTVADECGFSI